MTKAHKLDIFAVLRHISSKQEQFIDNLTDEDMKDIQPLVIMRWLSGVNSRRQVYTLNEVANVLVFPLANHKRLLLRVLMACTDSSAGRPSWMKTASKGSSKPMSVRVLCEYFKYPKRKALSALPLVPIHDLVMMAEDMGYQPDELQKLQREHKENTPRSKAT